MEYVYAAMLLHSAGKEINEDSVTAVLKAAGVDANEGRVKALVASLADVNIEEAIAKTAVAAAPAPAPAAGAAPAKEEKPAEEEGKGEEEAASGLASLFG
ncbi:MAG TPA: 50S ribosomal protein P1 [Candidatus Altiarchaeales archaeon]|nr:50S ribosomal protein P1 [Candidatus Altiarchaeales archaeon]